MYDDAEIDIVDLHIFGTILHVFARPRMGLTNRVLAQEHFGTTFAWGMVQRKSSDAHCLQLSSKKDRGLA